MLPAPLTSKEPLMPSRGITLEKWDCTCRQHNHITRFTERWYATYACSLSALQKI
jgi:hypothetical protein